MGAGAGLSEHVQVGRGGSMIRMWRIVLGDRSVEHDPSADP